MATILDMPQLSDTMKIGVLQKWRKNEGDKMVPGEVLAEVETDKAVMDFEAFDAGVLLKRLVDDGASVPVGSPIAIIGKTGEDVTKLVEEAKARASGGAKPAAAPAKPAPAAPPPAAVPGPTAAPAAARAPAAAPAPAGAPAPAAAPATARAVAPRPAPTPGPPAAPAAGAKILASPLARRLAGDSGLDLRSIQGSGPGGRIVERDVKAALEGGAAAPSAPAVDEHPGEEEPVAGSATPAAVLPLQLVPERRAEARPSSPPPAGDVVKPLSMMRRTIAARLLESKTTIPHFYLTADIDMDAAMEFREQVIAVHGSKLSVNDLVLKAAALAMRRIPEANASFTEEAIIQHARVDVGMAVAIEDGLLTPVIRDADKKTLGQIANEARELAKKARDRKLRPEEMTGATLSVSNLGMFGIKDFAAIINPPEAVIVAVGAVRKEPVVKDNKVVVGQRMSLTISCDHRVVDGALGAKVMQAIVAILERPISLAF